jgi:hypothetical protein
MTDEPDPLLRAVQAARDEAERQRILERALMEAAPSERLVHPGRDRSTNKAVMRNLPVLARGVSGTAPGTDPLGALLGAGRRER